jgi:succinate-acetate transporter protein
MASAGVPPNTQHHHEDGYRYSDGPAHYDYGHHNPQAGPKPHQATVSQVYDPSFYKIANPGPLGLISFALTTLVLGLYQCGAGLPGGNPHGNVGPFQAVFGLAVFMGGTAQFIAGILEFRVGNTFGLTVHCSYGAFWLAFAMFILPTIGIQEAYGGDAQAYSNAIGIFLIAWCFLTLIFLLATLKTNFAIITVFFLLTLAFFFLAIAEFIATSHPTGSIRVNRAGGVFAVLDALAAFYAGASALFTKDTTYFTLPLGEIDAGPPAGNASNGHNGHKAAKETSAA